MVTTGDAFPASNLDPNVWCFQIKDHQRLDNYAPTELYFVGASYAADTSWKLVVLCVELPCLSGWTSLAFLSSLRNFSCGKNGKFHDTSWIFTDFQNSLTCFNHFMFMSSKPVSAYLYHSREAVWNAEAPSIRCSQLLQRHPCPVQTQKVTGPGLAE